NRYVSEQVIKISAAVLFLIIGGWMLFAELRGAPAEEPAPTGQKVESRLLAWVVDVALAFEHAAHRDYLVLAAEAESPALRALFTDLAAEEAEHGERLRTGRETHATALDTAHGATELPTTRELEADVAAHDRAILDHAIEHEAATARFYTELARSTPIPPLRELFRGLAAHEREHVERLRGFAQADTAS
ncbi:MAG: ferritin family protein, partial [Planctomycetota bacterium]